ncbi:MAG: hypothetical protein RSE13_15175 [Planktothrix sp. GU0601_MAG3]|nr:MAG: hypothetical protein RSE13_15175 [Planktothrix sp. GU0601_MAG3]
MSFYLDNAIALFFLKCDRFLFRRCDRPFDILSGDHFQNIKNILL